MAEKTLYQIIDFLKQYTGDSTYWYPLCVLKKEIAVIAYNLDKLYSDGHIKQIELTLRKYGIDTVWTFQMQIGGMKLIEGDMCTFLYEKDCDGYTFPWNVEKYYFDNSQKWLIYVSHEGTITFTGNRLVGIAKENIGSQYLYG